MTSYTVGQLRQLKDGELPANAVHDMQSKYKDADRFFKMLEVWQQTVKWKDRIILPLAEHLFVVLKPDGRRVIKSTWGHEYCEAHENWKLHAKVFVRDTEGLMDQIYPRKMASDPNWMEIREYYDPITGTLLEVEAVPPGYPAVHDFKPDIDTFYRDWLQQPLTEVSAEDEVHLWPFCQSGGIEDVTHAGAQADRTRGVEQRNKS